MRKNKPNHGSLNLVRGRYYYKATLPGTDRRKTYPLIPCGGQAATTDRRMAVALANEWWDRAAAAVARGTGEVVYDGTLERLSELFLAAHQKDIAGKDREIQNKEMRFYRASFNDLMAFLHSVPFTTLAAELKSNRLLLWRKYLHTEKKICRNTINKKINIVKQMIQYAVNRELEPGHLLYALDAIKPLKKGQENFRDCGEVNPARWETVEKLFPYLPEMIQDMLTLIRHTGARPGEIRLMRPGDINQRDADGWVYSLARHKTDRYNRRRHIVIGPLAQPIVRKYLVRPAEAYCFPPQENHHGTGAYYTTGSFAKVITRAVRQYNTDHPKTPIEFHANQLRHTFATEVCLQYGLEATRCVLGHVTQQMTKRYARTAVEIGELEMAKKAVKKLG